MHPTMRLINDYIKMVAFLFSSILQGLPDGISTAVTIADKAAGFAEFLGIQKVNHPVVQRFLVKGIILDGHALIRTNLICLCNNLRLGLLIQLG